MVLAFPVEIRPMKAGDIDLVFDGLSGHDVQKPRTYVERSWKETLAGQRTTFLALAQGDFAGWGHLVYSSEYTFFREHGIPEIQNFDVIPSCRQQGVGSQLMDTIEQFAFEQYDAIGIGIGLYADYGAAQRIYVKPGYIPDGRGLMSHYHPVFPGSPVLVDDDLVLFLTKSKSNNT